MTIIDFIFAQYLSLLAWITGFLVCIVVGKWSGRMIFSWKNEDERILPRTIKSLFLGFVTLVIAAGAVNEAVNLFP